MSAVSLDARVLRVNIAFAASCVLFVAVVVMTTFLQFPSAPLSYVLLALGAGTFLGCLVGRAAVKAHSPRLAEQAELAHLLRLQSLKLKPEEAGRLVLANSKLELKPQQRSALRSALQKVLADLELKLQHLSSAQEREALQKAREAFQKVLADLEVLTDVELEERLRSAQSLLEGSQEQPRRQPG